MAGVGIVGTGWARSFILPALAHVDGLDVVAVASGSHENAVATAEEFAIPEACEDFQQLATLADVDLVVVATPPHLHQAATLAAIANGKHVLCEKPLAMSAAEAVTMRDAARQAGVLGLIDHELRFNPGRLRAKALIENNYVGEVHHVTCVYRANHGLRDRGHSWWYDSECGGGMLMAIGSHFIDAARWLFGEIAHVSCRLDTFVTHREHPTSGAAVPVDVDDTAHLSLDMASGATVNFSLSSISPGPPNAWIEIVGSDGWLCLNESMLTLTGSRGDGTEDLTPPDPARGLDGLGDPLWAPALVHQFRRISEALDADASVVKGAADFSDGVAVQRVIDSARNADAERRTVPIG